MQQPVQMYELKQLDRSAGKKHIQAQAYRFFRHSHPHKTAEQNSDQYVSNIRTHKSIVHKYPNRNFNTQERQKQHGIENSLLLWTHHLSFPDILDKFRCTICIQKFCTPGRAGAVFRNAGERRTVIAYGRFAFQNRSKNSCEQRLNISPPRILPTIDEFNIQKAKNECRL